MATSAWVALWCILTSSVAAAGTSSASSQPPQPPPPTLWFSFVFAARNDAYNGDAPLRLATSLRALAASLKEVTSLADKWEIIVVDWNSPSAPLHDNAHVAALKDSVLNGGGVRFLVVPPAQATKYCQPWCKYAPVSEVHALNAGIRRAHGNFVFRFDQDTIAAPRFVQHLATCVAVAPSSSSSTWLGDTHAWWSTRRESAQSDYDGLVADPLAYLATKTLRHFPSWLESEQATDGAFRYEDVDGLGAVGVLGMSARHWARCQGFNETSYRGYGHMEVELKYRCRLQYVNVGKVVDHAFVHIWHEDNHLNKPNNKWPSPPAPGDADAACCDGQPDWGLRGVRIREVVW